VIVVEFDKSTAHKDFYRPSLSLEPETVSRHRQGFTFFQIYLLIKNDAASTIFTIELIVKYTACEPTSVVNRNLRHHIDRLASGRKA
jgi:hypothetical protein